GGGGGWGDPLDRDPVLVLWDVVNEYITPETARKVYGVVVDPETRTINWQETRKLRQKMRRQERRCPPPEGLREKYLLKGED
ncbi:MAG: hypothetical protein F7C07_00315, partial [Desulfurococcales archaeon]|nr:hypothetical protein [Desulfurococcales archaeon]